MTNFYNIFIKTERNNLEWRTNVAIEYQKKNNLPHLLGTKRQVEWAVVLRLNAIKYIQTLKNDMNPYEYEMLTPFFEKIIYNKNARFFIENRFDIANPQSVKAFAEKLYHAYLISLEDGTDDMVDISHMVVVEDDDLPF